MRKDACGEREEEKKEREEEGVFVIRDIHCASALLSVPAGYAIKRIDKSDPKNCVFVFFVKEDIELMAQRYFLNRLEVRARTFADNLRSLKNQIYR